MAVVSRIATIALSNSLSVVLKTWQATAAVQDTAAGSSVVTTITRVDGGALAPADPDTFTLRYVDDAGNIIRTVTLNTTSASQTDTFFFTATGLSGGSARAGTIEIKMQVTKTTGGPTATYDIETDGAPNTPPQTFTTSQLDRGWIRSTTTAVIAVSNASAGGAKPSPFAYGNNIAGGDGGDSIFHRTTLGAAPFISQTLTAQVNPQGLSSASGASTTTIFDTTFTKVCDNRFPAASTAETATVATPGNATLTGQPWTVLTITTDSLTVDPRLTVSNHLMQIDDNVFGTPPMVKNDATNQRLAATQAFFSEQYVNARSAGINGLTVTETLTPVKPGSAVQNVGVTTSLQGGQDGWGGTFLAWSSQLPGGTWNKTCSITAPSDITGATYLLTSTASYTLLASNPSIRVAVLAAGSNTDAHVQLGNALTVAVAMENTATAKFLVPATSPVPTVQVLRFNTGSSTYQYLRPSDLTWQNITSSTVITGFTTATTPALVLATDGLTYTFALTVATAWTTIDIEVVAVLYDSSGTPYTDRVIVPILGSPNGHEGYSLDAAGLALSGALSFK